MKATTIGQALKLGVATGDFEFDLRKGFVSVSRNDEPLLRATRSCSLTVTVFVLRLLLTQCPLARVLFTGT